MTQPDQTIDLETPAGVAAWVRELPDENLRAIADRPIDQFNFLLVTAAGLELIVRGERG